MIRPLPTPNAGESKKVFVKRCMRNPTMESEYPKPDQRVAVCTSQWNKGTRAAPDAMNRGLTSRTIQLRADSIDEENRSVEAVLTSETPTTVFDWSSGRFIDEVLLMDGMRPADQVIMLHSHRRTGGDDVLGAVRDIHQENSLKMGRLYFDEGNGEELVDRIWRKVRRRFMRDVSVGYRVAPDGFVDIPPGGSRTVGKRQFTAPKDRTLRISSDWTLREVSVVPIGADEAAKIRAELDIREPDNADAGGRRCTSERIEPMSKQLRQYLESLGLKRDAPEDSARSFMALLDDEQRKRAEELDRPKDDLDAEMQRAEVSPANAGDEATRSAPATDPAAIVRETLRAEGRRKAEIRALAGEEIPTEIVERAIDEGWTAQRAASEFLAIIRKERAPAVTVTADAGDKLLGRMGDALMLQTDIGINEPDNSQRLERERAAHDLRAIGFQDLARHCLQIRGESSPVDPRELMRRAISTGIFANLLDNTATKTLALAYERAEVTFVQWAGRRIVANFKDHKDIKLSGFANIPEVGRGGEIADGTVIEAAETYAAKTYGIRFAVTRQQFIDDDLGAFLRIPYELGQAAAANVDDIAYTLLISALGLGPTMTEDSQTLFYASRTTPNYVTGAAYALADAGLAHVKMLLRKIIGLAGENLNASARFLIVPPELEHTARKLIESQELMIASSATSGAVTTTIMPTANVHRGSLIPIVEPRLSAGTAGTTAYYIATGPESRSKHLILARLRGSGGPVVERDDPDGVLGIGWRMYDDVGVGVSDWRGIVRANGTD